MSIQHRVITHDGDAIAQIISLGQRWVLYSTHPALHRLDGQVFGSMTEAQAAAMAQLPRPRQTVSAPAAA